MPRAIHQRLYTAEQTRELDRLAVAAGTDGFELMQRAGQALLRVVQERWPGIRALLICTGPGAAGGDGLVLAALARQAGLGVEVLTLAAVEKLRGEAASALAMARRQEIAVEAADTEGIRAALQRRQRNGAPGCVVVDAMLGTGIRGQVSPAYRDAILQINRSGLSVLSLDLPSGLDSDTGRVAGVAVKAAVTVSFIGLNRGLFTGDGPDHSGEVVFDRLGVSGDVHDQPGPSPPSAWRLTIRDVLPWLPARPLATHKGHCGRVAVAAGNRGFGGAGLLCSEAAARSRSAW